MSRRFGSSATRRRHAPLPERIGEYPLGRETGLPLVMCPDCGAARVVELVVQTDDNGNRGRIFFKCSKNVRGLEAIPGWCGFFEWQREYLARLVGEGTIVMALQDGGGRHGGAEQEAESRARGGMEAKIEALVGAVTTLSMVVGVGVLVAAMCVFK